MGTSEAYGDIVAFLSTHDSCCGPNFDRENCGYPGALCTNCTGVREANWKNISDHNPHTPDNFTFIYCPINTNYYGPCGRQAHCESQVISEAVWDLATNPQYGLPSRGIDQTTSWQIAETLFYLSRPTAGQAFSCISDASMRGCNGVSWFSTFRVVDDNDGNLSNGTPHAAAIFDSFNAHKIACLAVNNNNSSTCPNLAKPSLTATSSGGKVYLNWTFTTNDRSYKILRNEISVTSGYAKLATVSPPLHAYQDTQVANGIRYYYSVQAQSLNSSCSSPLATPVSITPVFSSFSISGFIRKDIHTPEPDVTVTADPGWAVTDENGMFTITDLPGDSSEYVVVPTKTCTAFTPSYTRLALKDADLAINYLSFQATSGCTLCFQELEQKLAKCSEGLGCPQTAFADYKVCLHQATQNASSMMNGAELLSVNYARAKGQPETETSTFTVTKEGDYFLNLINGDSVDNSARVSSAVVDLLPFGSIFKPKDFNKNVHLLVKPVHLLPGDYTLSVELRSQPGAFATIVISDKDFSLFPELP